MIERCWQLRKWDAIDELDIAAALIHANRGREKTAEQKAREFKELRKIEAEKAKKRQEATLKKGETIPVRENFPSPEEVGKSADIAAAAVGWSGKTAEKAAAVVDKIDALEDEGEDEAAEELRYELNTKSVSAAYAHSEATV